MALVKENKIMVAVLLSGALLVVLNLTLLSPAMPSIMVDLGVNAATIQWLVSAYALVEAIVVPLSAWLVGRFSTRKLFLGSMLLFLCGSIVGCIAPIFAILLIARILQAAATGVLMPMVLSHIILIFPRERRGAAMGLVGLIIAFAPAVGPSLGGLLSDSVGWRFVFVIVASLSTIVALAAFRFLPNFKGFEPSSFDAVSVVLSSIGLLCFLYGLATFTSASFFVVPLALVVIGAVFIALFVRRQARLENPLLHVDILKTRNYRMAVITMFLLQAALVSNSVILPLYIQNVLGATATVSGLVLLPGSILGAIAGFVAGRLFDRYGVRALALCGATLMALCGVGLTLFSIDSSIIFICLVNVGIGLAIQIINTPVNTWGINSLDNKMVPHANALTNTLNQVGGSFGTAFIVSLGALSGVFAPGASGLEQNYVSYHYSFIGVATLLVTVFVIAVFFIRNRKQRAQIPATSQESHALLYTAQDFMNPQSVLLKESDSVQDAMRIFAREDSSGAPIVSETGKLVGFLSTGDIMKYLGDLDTPFEGVYSSGISLQLFDDENFNERLAVLLGLKVMDLATKKVVCTNPDASLEKVCSTLANRKIKKLPVVEEEKVIGVISRKNIIQAVAAEL